MGWYFTECMYLICYHLTLMPHILVIFQFLTPTLFRQISQVTTTQPDNHAAILEPLSCSKIGDPDPDSTISRYALGLSGFCAVNRGCLIILFAYLNRLAAAHHSPPNCLPGSVLSLDVRPYYLIFYALIQIKPTPDCDYFTTLLF